MAYKFSKFARFWHPFRKKDVSKWFIMKKVLSNLIQVKINLNYFQKKNKNKLKMI